MSLLENLKANNTAEKYQLMILSAVAKLTHSSCLGKDGVDTGMIFKLHYSEDRPGMQPKNPNEPPYWTFEEFTKAVKPLEKDGLIKVCPYLEAYKESRLKLGGAA